MSNKIIRKLVSFCKSAYNLAIEYELIAAPRNAFAKVKAPVANKFEPQLFTQAEIKAIFDEPNPRLRLMFWVQLSTGLQARYEDALKEFGIELEEICIKIR